MKTTYLKTSFTAGEVAPDLLGRGDLRAYDNGAARLRNVFIKPTGGVTRRAGMRYLNTLPGEGRLIAFEFNTEQTYLIVLTHLRLDIYHDGVFVASLVAPWAADDIAQVAWSQSADTLLLTHASIMPQKLTRSSDGSGGGVWALSNWSFYAASDARILQPMYKFAASNVTVTPSGVSGTITLTASSPVFVDGHAGTRMRVANKEVLITVVNSPTVVTAQVKETLLNTTATLDWEEQAFSNVRGYPVSVAFHQDRLVIGGSRDLPNRLWMSQTGDLFNFDLGSGLDSEAIEFGIFSDQVNAIRAVFSGRHLQVFTSGAEWMVTGDPLTPALVQIKRQTRVGSMTRRYIAPLDVDGATLFVARSGAELREFVYTDVEAAYQSTDLSLLSHHMIFDPKDQDFDARRRLLFLVRGDGKFATLTVYRAEQVAAWTLHDTAGDVLSVCVAGDDVYMMVRRFGAVMLEQLDDALCTDSALVGESAVVPPAPLLSWSGLDHLNGQAVQIIADGAVRAPQTVSSGTINLTDPCYKIEAGLGFTHIIEPLPISNASGTGGGVGGGGARAVRMTEITLRILDTAAVRIDIGRGLKDVSLRSMNEGEGSGSSSITANSTPALHTGDVRLSSYGWYFDNTRPLWRIEQSTPLPFTLLSVQINVVGN
ncbi:MAG: hypothetical protein JNK24_07975 [Alphaproteobacteria bacterium]|nr:hypothetical protein [Alphaproteobacteria bacterium]